MQQDIPPTESRKRRAPLPVIIASRLMLVGGVIEVIVALIMLRLPIFLPLAAFLLIIGLGLLVIAFGVGKMRKWGLYGYSFIAVLSVALAGVTLITESNVVSIGLAGVQVIFLVYFWSIRRQFV